MIYRLSDDIDREKATARWDALMKKGATVELSEKTRRSLSQNAYLHLLLGVLALHIGERMDYVKEAIFKQVINPETFIVRRNGMTYLRSTSKLEKEEMADCITRLKVWALQEYDITLPDSDEREKLARIEMEMQTARMFL